LAYYFTLQQDSRSGTTLLVTDSRQGG